MLLRIECELPLKNFFCYATMTGWPPVQKIENMYQSLNLLPHTQTPHIECDINVHTAHVCTHTQLNIFVHILARYEQEDK